ncbi:hypothetical protein J18TS1_27520 [Oceanobacillus oncorhynchi subsp. incaldanensis]|nr:hypothetical protein J18TS1_27520 [Oceanobacillus oncorhynchi subsp. incaldanensis]
MYQLKQKRKSFLDEYYIFSYNYFDTLFYSGINDMKSPVYGKNVITNLIDSEM